MRYVFFLFASIRVNAMESINGTSQNLEKLFTCTQLVIAKHLQQHFRPLNLLESALELYQAQHKKENNLLLQQYGHYICACYTAPVHVLYINKTVKNGLVATKALKEGDYIGEYIGKIRDSSHGKNNDYAWRYSPLDDCPLVVDALKYGNLLRFSNHSPTQNIKAKQVLLDGMWHTIYIACKAIPIGQELRVNYGESYWEDRETSE